MQRSALFVIALATASLAGCSGSTPATTNDGGGATGPTDAAGIDVTIANGDGSTNPPADGSVTGADSSSSADDSGGGGADDSGGGSDGGDASTDDASFVEAPHPALPRVINYGGVVLTAPKLVTVTYKGDANQASYQSFGQTVASSAWWNTVRADYCDVDDAGVPDTTCIGDGPAGTSIVIQSAPASSYADSSYDDTESALQLYIQSLIPSVIPQPDPQTLLMFYFPSTTTITLDGLTSCTGFGGYHNAMTVNGVTFAYAIMPECPVAAGGTTALQYVTLAASHELAEAATDPFSAALVGGQLSYYLDFDDPAAYAWNDLVGGEVGDLCFDYLGLGQDETTEGSFTVQRIWSNAAAAAGNDPCVPALSHPYFNVAPERWLVTDDVGSTVTFTADAFSSAAVADWTVYGYDLNATSSASNPYLTIQVAAPGGALGSTAVVGNGDKVTVSVTLHKDPGTALMESSGGAAGLLISVNSANPRLATRGHYWPFVVAPEADQIDAGFAGVDAAMGSPRRPKLSRAQQLRARELLRTFR